MFRSTAIAIEVSGDTICLAVVKDKDINLETLRTYELDEGIIKDGRLMQPVPIQNILSHFLAAHRLPNRTKLILLLKNPLAMFRFAQLPKLSEKELDKTAKLNYKSYLPVEEKDYRVDYKPLHITGRTKEAFPNGMLYVSVLFAAFPRDVLEAYMKIFERLALTTVLVDLYQNCIADYFGALQQDNLLVVSRYENRLAVVFVAEGCLQGIRELTVEEDVQHLIEDIEKLPGYFAYTPIDTIYFMEAEHEKEMWATVYPDCSFVFLQGNHYALQALVRRYFQKHNRKRVFL